MSNSPTFPVFPGKSSLGTYTKHTQLTRIIRWRQKLISSKILKTANARPATVN